MTQPHCPACQARTPTHSQQLRHIAQVVDRAYELTFDRNGECLDLPEKTVEITCDIIVALLIQFRALRFTSTHTAHDP
jgi:hypothetical protein